MTVDNKQIIRQAYKIAENKDLEGWVAAFTDDGTFTDESIGVTYRGPGELPKTVEIYARAFPDMHRELYRIYVTGDIVVDVFELSDGKIKRFDCYPSGTLIRPPMRSLASLRRCK